jgi:hypothetical protein
MCGGRGKANDDTVTSLCDEGMRRCLSEIARGDGSPSAFDVRVVQFDIGPDLHTAERRDGFEDHQPGARSRARLRSLLSLFATTTSNVSPV